MDNFCIFKYAWHIQFQLYLTKLQADAFFCLLEWWNWEKEAVPELLYALKVAADRTSLLTTRFFECKHPFIDKPIQVTYNWAR